MSIQFRIADAQDGASEVATKTRESLQQWINSVHPAIDSVDTMQALTQEEIRALKECGAKMFGDELALVTSSGVFSYTPKYTDDVYNAIAALVRTLANRYTDVYDGTEFLRSESYLHEGIMREFSKHMFEKKLTMTPSHTRAFVEGVSGSDYTGNYVDAWLHTRLRRASLNAGVYHATLRNFGVGSAMNNGFSAQRESLVRAMDELVGTPFSYYGSTYNVQPTNPSVPMILAIAYMDVDGPWIAGYLTPDDTARQRFGRKRFGAWLKDSGVYTDVEIRTYVEGAKTGQASGNYVIYPNDYLFGDVYRAAADNVGSCMAAHADEYNTWGGIHPCDVYSSCYYGTGDNGLALFTAENDHGAITGRGIWHAATQKIVRWYGDEGELRALKRLGIVTSRSALEGSWLTYINSGSKFITPYIDGDIEYGEVRAQERRVYLRTDGVNLSETSGVVGISTVWCINEDEYVDQDETTYQVEHNTYISESCDEWRCAVTDEWVPDDQRTSIYLDGEEQEVSDRVTDRCSQYLRKIEPSEEMIDAYFSKEVVGEYRGPTNYELR